MVSPIPKSVKKLWQKWNLRGCVLVSLLLQTVLILGAPMRKRSSNIWIILIIWVSYLLADSAANFGIGLISNSQGDTPLIIPGLHKNGTIDIHKSGTADINADLLAFWAPFLLLHLGGPDTITAFSLEDNTLWLRHLFGLISQVIATIYVFILSFPNNILWLPTVLLFLAGTVKYGERTRALYLASLDSFKESMLKAPDPGPNYAKLMEEYSSKKDSKLPTHIELTAERSRESRAVTYEIDERELEKNVALVRHAYHFFQIFKGLVVDLIFSFHERYESRVFFLDRTSEEAYKLLAVELNFMYEALFTKVVVVHSKLGYLLRATSFTTVSIALVFFFKLDKHDFHGFDVGSTYTLLYGAISLDLIALFMLIFSDWTVAAMKKSQQNSCIAQILEKYLNLKRSRWPTTTENCLECTRRILFRRWSESVSTFNLIKYSLKERQKITPTIFDYIGIGYIKIIEFMGLKDLRDKMKYKESKRLKENLWSFIFTELKSKSMLADDSETARRICSAKGDWTLQDGHWDDNIRSSLLPYVVNVDYDQSILLWHVATELCYNTDGREDNDRCDFSKTLSDYMLYLIVMQPSLTSSIAGIGQIRFRDTCAEAEKFFSRRELGSGEEQFPEKTACMRILDINTDVKPVAVKGDRSKSVLFDACMLAKELKKVKDKWKLMSEVWVELLSYTASHCRADNHAQLLSKGGELATFVWLLMAHFGIGEQFQINEGHARAKLIVGK